MLDILTKIRQFSKRNYDVDSRWASIDEFCSTLHKVDIHSNSAKLGGIPLYSTQNTAYVDEKDSHSLIIGSTGSKKTRLIGMPALRLFAYSGESFIATDPKAELYEKTYSILKQLDYNIYVINLRDPVRSNAWNPLLLPYKLYNSEYRDKAIEMIDDLASNIFLTELSKNDPYWQRSAADFFMGLIFILFECALSEKEINFKSLVALKAQAMYMPPYNSVDKEKNFFQTPYIKEHFLDFIDKSSFAYACLSGTIFNADKTRDCILSSFDQPMRPFFSQENLINMLSDSDFSFDILGKEKTALFLIMPDEKTTYHKLVSIFIKQCYELLILEAHKFADKKFPIRINFLLDEFSSLPRINDFPAMVTAARSRNIRFNLIVQSLYQLKYKYGEEAETIKGNCNNWIYLASKELPLLHELSQLAGTKGNNTPLITVSNLQRLSKEKGEALVFHDRLYPFITHLSDIDEYPTHNESSKSEFDYPTNQKKVEKIFDFKIFCEYVSRQDKAKLFRYNHVKQMEPDINDIILNALDILEKAHYRTFSNLNISEDKLSFLALAIGEELVLGDILPSTVGNTEINYTIKKLNTIHSKMTTLFTETLEEIQIKISNLIVTPRYININGDIQNSLDSLGIKLVCLEEDKDNYILKYLPYKEAPKPDEEEDFDAYASYIQTTIDYFKKT